MAGFADVQNEEQFKAVLKAGVAAKKIPEQLVLGFLDFYNNYKSVHLNLSSHPKLTVPNATYRLLTPPAKSLLPSNLLSV